MMTTYPTEYNGIHGTGYHHDLLQIFSIADTLGRKTPEARMMLQNTNTAALLLTSLFPFLMFRLGSRL